MITIRQFTRHNWPVDCRRAVWIAIELDVYTGCVCVCVCTVVGCADPVIPSSAWFQRTPDGHGVVGCRRPGDVTRGDDVTWRVECDVVGLQWNRDVTELLHNCSSSRKYVTTFSQRPL